MKYKNSLIGSISAFAGILLMILVAVYGIMVQESFLNYTNHKYRVWNNLSMEEEDLQSVVHSMISYVKGKTDSPQTMVQIKGNQVEFFNQKEIGHLADVRVLIRNSVFVMIGLFIIVVAGVWSLVLKKEYQALCKGISCAWILLIAVSAVIGILAVVDINIVVSGFHKIFLSGSKWVLNPALDRSVWMFRTYMYKDVLLVLGGIIAGVAVVTLAIRKVICLFITKINLTKK